MKSSFILPRPSVLKQRIPCAEQHSPKVISSLLRREFIMGGHLLTWELNNKIESPFCRATRITEPSQHHGRPTAGATLASKKRRVDHISCILHITCTGKRTAQGCPPCTFASYISTHRYAQEYTKPRDFHTNFASQHVLLASSHTWLIVKGTNTPDACLIEGLDQHEDTTHTHTHTHIHTHTTNMRFPRSLACLWGLRRQLHCLTCLKDTHAHTHIHTHLMRVSLRFLTSFRAAMLQGQT